MQAPKSWMARLAGSTFVSTSKPNGAKVSNDFLRVQTAVFHEVQVVSFLLALLLRFIHACPFCLTRSHFGSPLFRDKARYHTCRSPDKFYHGLGAGIHM